MGPAWANEFLTPKKLGRGVLILFPPRTKWEREGKYVRCTGKASEKVEILSKVTSRKDHCVPEYPKPD